MTGVSASVVVPARDAGGTLARTLACLCAQEAPFPYEVIVVDDESTDDTPAIAASAGAPVRLVRQPAAGAGAARNRGVAEASGDLLAFCDADCFPQLGWLAAGVRALESAGLVQGKVLPEPGVSIGPFDRSLWITHEVGLWETANLFVTRAVFDRAGGFEDWLGGAGGRPMGEDVWFGWRALRAGARSAFCAEALAHHAVFPGSPHAYVAERRRLRHFPALARKIPELREHFFYRRVFLNERTAALDGALAAVGLAALLRRPWPLAGVLPYGRVASGRHTRGRKVIAVDVLADLVGLAALLRGSAENRSPVL